MFSNQDIRDIFQSLPPRKSSDTKNLPHVLLSLSGHGFVTARHVSDEFDLRMTKDSQRISVLSLGRTLDIDQDTVLHLVQASPSLALLNGDKSTVITKDERDSLEKNLLELADEQFVSKPTFSLEHDVSMESIDAFTHLLDDTTKLKEGLLETGGHIFSSSYEQRVLDAIRDYLDQSFKEAEPVELSSDMLPGAPPAEYIKKQIPWLLETMDLAPQFHVTLGTSSLRCTPKQSILRKKDEQITQIQEGNISHIDTASFLKKFSEIYPTYKDAQAYFETLPEILFRDSVVISKVWLSKIGDGLLQDLDTDGWADVGSNTTAHFPAICQNFVLEWLNQYIDTAYTQRPNGPQLCRVDSFVLTATKNNDEREALFKFAKADAVRQWQRLKETADAEAKFQISSITDVIPVDQPILRAMAQRKSIDREVEEQFWNEISSFEIQNESDFSNFWVNRVVSRLHNYSQGLEAIEDTKLREQLADLLSTYVQKDLVPDSVTKARSQGLACSRKTRKNVQKLESSMEEGKANITKIISAIEKFDKKQGIEELAAASFDEAKKALVDDMVRKMQKKKQSDGPLLFLTLVIILFARQYSGVIYATGKFAPKLLKQLKSSLGLEQYEQLERWKEGAKAGTLTSQDKEGMKQMALPSDE